MSNKQEPTTSSSPISSVEAGPVRTCPISAGKLALQEKSQGYGPNLPAALASCDPENISSWKTCQRSIFGGLEAFSGAWPRAGMMLSGIAYQLKPSAPITGGIASSALPGPNKSGQWPSPSANDWKGSSRPGQRRRQLSEAPTIVGGLLNPRWVEWLQGFPDSWTELDASEIP